MVNRAVSVPLCNCMQIALFNFLLISLRLPALSVIWVTLILLSHAAGDWSYARYKKKKEAGAVRRICSTGARANAHTCTEMQ